MHRVTQVEATPLEADGIVALTGGAERVETALHLLAESRARVLLLSGIGGGAELAELAHRAGLDPARLPGRVTLGRQATSTRGNAVETASWVRENGIRSLIVVTAGYHMPRALTELSRAMPDVTLYPVPVMPPAMHGPAGLRDRGTLRLMAEEYSKWLLARIGLSWFGLQNEIAGLDSEPRASHEMARFKGNRAG
jgi:uncharacterized SAM-binding protein YcdF (DUF218 family)